MPLEENEDWGIRTYEIFFPGFPSEAEAEKELDRKGRYYKDKGGVVCRTTPAEQKKHLKKRG